MALAFVASMVSKIGEYLAPQVGRQFGYLIFYNRNIENLKEQVRKLEDKRVGTQLLVDEATRNRTRNREIIGPDVEQWLKKVDDLDKEAQKFLEDEVKANKGCLNGWCPNLKSRYSLSRKATKKTQVMVEICAEENLPRVSYPAPPVEITFTSTEGFKAFESRRSIMKEVMEALADDSINMIGICGMGGVGKTTLVKEVAQKAKENKLLDKIVIAVVSQKPDLIKIQGAIAEQLGFGLFEGKDLLARASDLRQRILSSEKVLIILDDVWERLELNQIGIPFGNDHKGCKIVLTTRSEDVCKDMRTQKQITIQVLHEEEAWNLFKEMAGISSDTSPTTTDLHSTQKAIAKECGGLPIAILTIGKALYGKEKPYWDDALNQLRKAMDKNIRGVDGKVFQSLELNYNYLREEAKKLFLLCSLFPEDFSIQIEDLVRYEFGLKLFEGIDTVGDARNRVHALVDNLMKCYLLMDDEKGVSVRMHNVIRDVAISIASRKEHSFMVRCDEALEEWSEEDRHKNYTAISLRCTAMHDLPDNLELSNLNLLRLEYNRELPETPDCFYQGMKELKVVALSNMDVQSLPTSLRCLTNLQTLSLYHCTLSGDISLIGALKNLEILSFTYYSTMEELPKEIANLTRLKLLDLLGCEVERITPGVLSSLSRLEELYVGRNVRRWSVPSLSKLEEEEEEQEGKGLEIISDATAASITELASLSNLVALDIHIQFWPKDFVLEKVKKFRISVGQQYAFFDNFDSYLLKRQLKLDGVDASDVMESGIKMLLKSTEILELRDIAGLKNILCDLLCKDSFEYLEKLTVGGCRDLEYLINTTTEEDDDGVVPQRAFPVLEDLVLNWLDNFKGIICDSQQQLSKKKKKKKKEVELQNFPQIPHHNKIGGPRQLDWFCNLTYVRMSTCDMVESLFDLSMARGLVQLRTLDIRRCKMMESIVSSSEGGEEHEKTTAAVDPIEFPKLQKLDLDGLPSLITFCKAVNAIELPQLNELKLVDIPKLKSLYHLFDKVELTSIEKLFLSGMDNLIEIWPRELKGFNNLTSLTVKGCASLRNLFSSSSMAKLLVQLQELEITECLAMEAIIAKEQRVDDDGVTTTNTIIMFPQLTSLKLSGLPNLMSFCPQGYTFEGSFLKKVQVINCPKMAVLPSEFEQIQELRYNSLESEAVKKLFLLCSLFPKDYHIQIEDLVRYGIGLKLFEGIGIVGDTRNRVHALVDDLMKCYLLMDDKKGVSVRMHVVIRDVAMSIASRKEHSFMVRCDEALEEWSEEDRHKNYTAISLRCTGMHGLPDNLELPNLKLLLLEYNHELPKTPDCFYQGMKELKVLALSDMDVQSLPASLRRLTNIRTLSLCNCKLSGDISVIGALKNLEILSFAGSTVEELSKEIAHLTRLKLLDLIGCKVERISPGVLSSLSRLEELYVGDNVRRWSVPILSKLVEQEIISDAAAASITELASLSNLVALDIHIQFWPKDFVLGKVKKFRISVGQYASFNSFDSYLLKNQLRLSKVDTSVMESGIKMLLKSTEFLELSGITGLKNIPCDSYKDIFEYLKKLSVEDCRDLEYLINTTTEDDDDDDDGVVPQRAFPVLEDLFLKKLDNFKGIICDGRQLSLKVLELQYLPEICHRNKDFKQKSGPTQLDWLCNLTSVQMVQCPMVESMFSLSMVRGLMQLQTLHIDKCEMMESIVSSSEGGKHEITTAAADQIKFPKLQKLYLRELPSFSAFCKAVNAIELPQLNELNLIDIPKLRNLCHPASESNCDTIIRPLFDKVAFSRLEKLHVSNCGSFLNLFSPSTTRCLVHLKELVINKCSIMEEVVVENEDEDKEEVREGRTLFPKLKYLELNDLPLLRCFWHLAHDWELPLVEYVIIFDCPKMETFSRGFIRIPNAEVVWVKWWALDGGVEGLLTVDLNATIQALHKSKTEITTVEAATSARSRFFLLGQKEPLLEKGIQVRMRSTKKRPSFRSLTKFWDSIEEL